MLPIILILICFFTAALVFFIHKKQTSRRRLGDLEVLLTPVDAAALGNLLHEREDAFLRQNLAPRAYRKIKRKRVRAAQEYVWKIFRNAYVLSRIAGLVLDSSDPEVHETAQKLAYDAVELRKYAVLTLLLLTAQSLYPNFEIASFKVRERYTSLAERASWLYRLRFPENPIRISTALCG